METEPTMVTVTEEVVTLDGDRGHVRTVRTWQEPLDLNKPTEDEEDNDGEDLDPDWLAQELKKLGFTQI